MAGKIAKLKAPRKARKQINRRSKPEHPVLADIEFSCVLGALQGCCRPAYPVEIILCPLPEGVMGACHPRSDIETDVFEIRLNCEMQPPQAVEVLVHEWAHALAWNHNHDALIDAVEADGLTPTIEDALHDPAWGVAYSKTYRAYLHGRRLAAALTTSKLRAKAKEELKQLIGYNGIKEVRYEDKN